MKPAHVAPIGSILPPDYFAPGISMMRGETVCSLWAVAHYAGESFRYERESFGGVWVRVG